MLGVGLTPTSFLRRNLYFLPLTSNTNLRLTSNYELLEATGELPTDNLAIWQPNNLTTTAPKVVVFGIIFTGPHILVVMQTNRI